MEHHLRDAGYPADDIYFINLGLLPGTTVDSLQRYASDVLNKLKQIWVTENSKVDVIVHSMGGLDYRWAIEKLNGAKYVDDLVTLGTPHQGRTSPTYS